MSLLDLADQISGVLPEHPDLVANLIQTYLQANKMDWKNYVSFSPTHYTRNRVTQTPQCELIIMCWNPDQSTFIHDHGDSDCWMGIITGDIAETIYALPEDPQVDQSIEIRPIISSEYVSGQVGHISNRKGIHEIGAIKTASVTLHVYAPPLKKIQLYRRSPDSIRLELDSVVDMSRDIGSSRVS